MFRSSGFIGNSTVIYLRFWCHSIKQRTLITTGLVGIDQQSLPLEPFSSSIDVKTLSIVLIFVQQEHYFVEIFSGFYIVQPSNDNREIPITLVSYFLYLCLIGSDLHSRTPFHYEFCHYVCFVLSDVFLSEQKLTVQIGKVYGVHVHQMDVSDTAHCQVFDDFTAQSSSSDH